MIKLVAKGNLDAETHEGYEKPLVIPLDTIKRILAKIDVWVIELNDGRTCKTEGCIPLRFMDQEDVPCTALLMPNPDSGFYDPKTDNIDESDATFDVAEIDRIYLHDYCEFSIVQKGQQDEEEDCPESYLQEGTEIRFRFD